MPLTLASDHDKQESKTFIHTKYFANNKPVELTYHKAGLLMQYPRKYQAKKVMKFLVLKVEAQIPRCLEVKVFMTHL